MQGLPIRHLDLFSGIGGFALATEMVWDNVEHIFCDNDPFSQAILKKHWPNATIYGDIKELTAERIATDTTRRRLEGREVSVRQGRPHKAPADAYRIDILTGGFPCQPFSAAGRRKGTEDDRHLWPEMLRVIREVSPTWVIGENVGGLLTWNSGMVFEQVCVDLEDAGYEVQAFVIPAAGVGAPHQRNRVWIVAHSKYKPARNTKRARHDQGTSDRAAGPDTLAANAGRQRRQQESGSAHGDEGAHEGRSPLPAHQSAGRDKDAADTKGARRREGNAQRGGTSQGATAPGQRDGSADGFSPWGGEDWPAVAARLCAVDDGLSTGLVRPRGWRNAALKAAGNAIVPQVAAQVMRAIAAAS